MLDVTQNIRVGLSVVAVVIGGLVLGVTLALVARSWRTPRRFHVICLGTSYLAISTRPAFSFFTLDVSPGWYAFYAAAWLVGLIGLGLILRAGGRSPVPTNGQGAKGSNHVS